MRFVRVGTLDEPDRLPPDIHIFTASKQPWVQLPPDAVAVPEYYDARERWPAETLRRGAILRGKQGWKRPAYRVRRRGATMPPFLDTNRLTRPRVPP
jgi:hypothetical protein